MKKAFLSVLGLTLAGSLSHACLEGGGLFQLMTPKKDVIANYDIRTGQRVANSRSFSVSNAYFVKVKNGKVLLGESICVGEESCESLNVSGFKAPMDVLFIYETFNESRSNAIIASGLFLGKKAPVAKGVEFGATPPPKPQVGEQETLRVLDCAIPVK